MSTISLWKFPKSLIPELKQAYLNQEWMWLINQYNEYMVGGEKLCPVCPDSMEKIKVYLKPIFLADIEVLYREGKEATEKDLVELFVKHVSPTSDPVTISRIPENYLKPIIATFCNADLKARLVSEKRRKQLLKKVLRVHRSTFNVRYCDDCTGNGHQE